MHHIGINYGHNSTVAVVKDGRLIFCQSEERLNRIKNSTGFPEQTLRHVYSQVCDPGEVTSATLSFLDPVHGYLHLKQREFKPFEYGRYLSPEHDMSRFLAGTKLRWQLAAAKSKYIRHSKSLQRKAHEYFSKSLRLPPDRVGYIDHHQAHAFSVISNIDDWGKGLVFTLDGVGDKKCATVSIYENGKLELVSEVNHYSSLGYYYSAITGLMGMKSGAHEFKVMGLAPYSRREYYLPILERFRNLLTITDKGTFKSTIPPSALRSTLGDIIQYERFDNIAGAIQEFTEELIIKWVHYWIQATGIHNIGVAGGVFMNVKACQKLLESPEISKFYVMPSAGDETTAIGAAFWAAQKYEASVKLQPIKDLYLGMEYSEQDIEATFRELEVSNRYEVLQPANINVEVGALLAANQMVARCTGRMEFGARALGNRSILANASNIKNIEIINSAIKNRDFWMPFAPSILCEDLGRYIVESERMFAPYMSVTFDSTDEAERDLSAAIHPRDKTVRFQSVVREWNPDYHEIILDYKKRTGYSGILNTSFNIHGEPIVCSPSDAVRTLDRSGLKYLAIGPYLLRKKLTFCSGD